MAVLNTGGFALTAPQPALVGPNIQPLIFPYANGATLAPNAHGELLLQGLQAGSAAGAPIAAGLTSLGAAFNGLTQKQKELAIKQAAVQESALPAAQQAAANQYVQNQNAGILLNKANKALNPQANPPPTLPDQGPPINIQPQPSGGNFGTTSTIPTTGAAASPIASGIQGAGASNVPASQPPLDINGFNPHYVHSPDPRIFPGPGGIPMAMANDGSIMGLDPNTENQIKQELLAKVPAYSSLTTDATGEPTGRQTVDSKGQVTNGPIIPAEVMQANHEWQTSKPSTTYNEVARNYSVLENLNKVVQSGTPLTTIQTVEAVKAAAKMIDPNAQITEANYKEYVNTQDWISKFGNEASKYLGSGSTILSPKAFNDLYTATKPTYDSQKQAYQEAAKNNQKAFVKMGGSQKQAEAAYQDNSDDLEKTFGINQKASNPSKGLTQKAQSVKSQMEAYHQQNPDLTPDQVIQHFQPQGK